MEIKLTNTPYDDVFRTLLNDCSNLIIPVINEMFGEEYSGEEEIIFTANEHFLNQQDGNEDEIITDTCFKISGKKQKNIIWNVKAVLTTVCWIISEYTRCTIIDMSNKVLEHIAKKYDSVRKGVKSVMGGKVLEYEAKAIRNEGILKGREEGREEGRLLTVRIFQEAKKNPSYTNEQIAEKAGCTVSEVLDTLKMFGI